jgi:hypothetical protein
MYMGMTAAYVSIVFRWRAHEATRHSEIGDLSMTNPSLSTDGLAHLHDVMTSHVEAGEMPGLVTLVARGDDVHVDAMRRASRRAFTREA